METKIAILGLMSVILMLGSVFVYLKTSTNTNPIADYSIAGLIISSGLQTMVVALNKER